MFSASKSGQYGGYQISRSVRLRASASAYLNRTFAAAPTVRTKQTFSTWVKRGALGTQQRILDCYDGSSAFSTVLYFLANDTLEFDFGGSSQYVLNTTQVFRDPSAWYHIFVSIDTTQATASSRVLLYVNGVQVTAFGTANYPAQNSLSQIAINTASNIIGASNGHTNYYVDGYMAEVNFIDGQALTPTSFGQYNAYGVWSPLKYNGTYGTNGFYLNFSSNATAAALGTDFSGNSNTWTVNNISVTAGVTYDSMLDNPTQWSDGGNNRGNYAVLNPIAKNGDANTTLSNANLTFTGSSSATTAARAPSSISVSSGKYYVEFTRTDAVGIGNQVGAGISTTTSALSTTTYSGNPTSSGASASEWMLTDRGYACNGSTYTNLSGTLGTIGQNDVVQVCIDMDNKYIWWGKNNTFVGSPSAGTGATFTNLPSDVVFVDYIGPNLAGVLVANFGQRPFSYTPPSGFKALNTFNLPSSTIPNGAQYMAATTYTGNGSTQTITNGGNNTIGVTFQPDFVWIKDRTAANSNMLYDSIRGIYNVLVSNATQAEVSLSTSLTAFNSNGFSVGSYANVNTNTDALIAWQWKAGNGSSSNTNGSITSTVSVNATAGFSVVTYTGNGTVGATIGHGLGVAPAFTIFKNRSSTPNWVSYHQSLGATKAIYLNLTNAAAVDGVWNNTAPTSTVIRLDGSASANVNASGNNYVAYCWAEVAGFSKFGSYTGNGSADGPFVYCGFRPRFILVKDASNLQDWKLIDTSRNTYNIANSLLAANVSSAEDTNTVYNFDILSNGFKVRNTYGYDNTSGDTYIFAAFAENPFKNALAR